MITPSSVKFATQLEAVIAFTSIILAKKICRQKALVNEQETEKEQNKEMMGG